MSNDPSTPGIEASAAAEDPATATVKLRELLRGDPLNADAYRALASAVESPRQFETRLGTVTVRRSDQDPELSRASNALQRGDLETAEIILRRRLLERPDDAPALWLMAGLATALGFAKQAESLLRLAIEVRPDLAGARIDLARALEQRGQVAEALEILDAVLEREPNHFLAKACKAANLSRVGRFEECLNLYQLLVEEHPERPELWTGYGHALKTMGRSEEGAKAMRRAVEVAPRNGEAWWNLANLKTAKFTRNDVELDGRGSGREFARQ